jgi:hypothetical protein
MTTTVKTTAAGLILAIDLSKYKGVARSGPLVLPFQFFRTHPLERPHQRNASRISARYGIVQTVEVGSMFRIRVLFLAGNLGTQSLAKVLQSGNAISHGLLGQHGGDLRAGTIAR